MGDEMTSLAVIIGSAPCESWDNLKRYSWRVPMLLLPMGAGSGQSRRECLSTGM